ncbi:MAG: transglycosylase domain-containing protein [Thermoleophilaceae bacterium]|nr:transglycosylase domain-containing protein [Thermoleophilaceae bacterium]
MTPENGSGSQRPKLKKLRLFMILAGLCVLAGISTVFGMMMAVSTDLDDLDNTAEYNAARNSVLLDQNGVEFARLTGNQNRILIEESEVSPVLKNAVIAIEDRRFYEHSGVDYTGIARAIYQDIRQQSAAQGASTITQQFVKNALAAQATRTVFQKLREAALAYHLERQWTKQKILTQYLNTVYFGNGAYGVEAAMRTYFAQSQGFTQEELREDPTIRLSEAVSPAEAALLAAVIASPSAYDPIQNPDAALARRDLVLDNMLGQGMINESDHIQATGTPLPTEDEIEPPALDSDYPYFTTWVTQQLVDRYQPGRIFGGGWSINTTLDRELQETAEGVIASQLSGIGPSASLVAIDNGTGEVRAMVGGDDYDARPFNLATNGHRQPGSAIKAFTLVAALEAGKTPEDTFTSAPTTLPDPDTPGGFQVKNYEGNYSGVTTLRSATAASDNTVYATLGLEIGTKKIAGLARRMGIRTPLSTNPAMTLGGLEEGVTPLEMAFAYATIANRGMRRSGTLAASPTGPVAIEEVDTASGETIDANEPRTARVFPSAVGDTAVELLTGVVEDGTGTAAQVDEPAWGKTGTTESYGDAWFVGSTADYTVAVWVGYPDSSQPMKTEYNGGPVAGGTYPAQIWHDFMAVALEIQAEKEAAREARNPDEDETSTEEVISEPVEEVPVEELPSRKSREAEAVEEAPVEEVPVEKAPVEQLPPEGGGGANGKSGIDGGFIE